MSLSKQLLAIGLIINFLSVSITSTAHANGRAELVREFQGLLENRGVREALLEAGIAQSRNYDELARMLADDVRAPQFRSALRKINEELRGTSQAQYGLLAAEETQTLQRMIEESGLKGWTPQKVRTTAELAAQMAEITRARISEVPVNTLGTLNRSKIAANYKTELSQEELDLFIDALAAKSKMPRAEIILRFDEYRDIMHRLIPEQRMATPRAFIEEVQARLADFMRSLDQQVGPASVADRTFMRSNFRLRLAALVAASGAVTLVTEYGMHGSEIFNKSPRVVIGEIASFTIAEFVLVSIGAEKLSGEFKNFIGARVKTGELTAENVSQTFFRKGLNKAQEMLDNSIATSRNAIESAIPNGVTIRGVRVNGASVNNAAEWGAARSREWARNVPQLFGVGFASGLIGFGAAEWEDDGTPTEERIARVAWNSFMVGFFMATSSNFRYTFGITPISTAIEKALPNNPRLAGFLVLAMGTANDFFGTWDYLGRNKRVLENNLTYYGDHVESLAESLSEELGYEMQLDWEYNFSYPKESQKKH